MRRLDCEVGRFRTKKKVSKGCLLSDVLFNILFGDLKEKMKKRKVGGWVIGKKKI